MTSDKQAVREGSVTVFLSLLLPILLALIGTLLEAARLPSVKSVISSGTRQSMQMMFSDYNRELWDDYHLFAYTGTEMEALEEIKRGINSFTMQEEKSSLDLWNMDLKEIFMEEKEFLTDEDGDILKHEAVEYMKYQAPKEFVTVLAQFFGVLKETGSSAKIVEEKLAAEGELYQYSEKMLEFMELIDGIDFGKEGVEYQGDLLKVRKSFVKQFLYKDASKSFVGIDNDIVWDSLKNNYFQAGKALDNLEQILKEAESVFEKTAEQDRELETLSEEIKKRLNSSWEKESKEIKTKTQEIEDCIEKALKFIPELKEQQETAAKAVENYRAVLKEQEGSISEEMKKSFSEDCDELSASVGIRTEGGRTKRPLCDLEAMEQCLKDNSLILHSVRNAVNLDQNITFTSVKQKEKEISAAMQQAEQYHVSEFIFSYNITEKKEKIQNPMEALKQLGNPTLLSLVAKNEKEISDAELGSVEHVFSEKQENNGFYFGKDEIPDFSTENNGLFSSIFGEFSSYFVDSKISLDSLSGITQSILQELLLNAYVQTSFYNAETEKKNEKVSVLKYEQEYILSENKKDKDNLAALVRNLSVIRMICNYMALLSDSAKQKEAAAAAAVIVGFTGLEPLVKVVESAILLVWAYEEGIVDIASLLQGKRVPLIKRPSQISLTFPELLAFGRTLVQEKAENMEDSEAGISYSQYLYVFLCLQKQKTTIYRMADIIQFNMKRRYQETFLLNQAIFGCRIRGAYHVPPVFFKFPFVTQISGGDLTGWNMEVLEEMAY